MVPIAGKRGRLRARPSFYLARQIYLSRYSNVPVSPAELPFYLSLNFNSHPVAMNETGKSYALKFIPATECPK